MTGMIDILERNLIYYTNLRGNLDRKCLFLNKEQADDFVVHSVTKIKEDLTVKGII